MNTTMNLPTRKKPEVLSPAGNLRGLKTAVDYGVEWVPGRLTISDNDKLRSVATLAGLSKPASRTAQTA